MYIYVYMFNMFNICLIYIYDMVCNDQRDMMSILWLDPSCK